MFSCLAPPMPWFHRNFHDRCLHKLKRPRSEMIELINKAVYLFGSFSFFQDNSKSLLSYIVAYYLRHFDEVCFGSCLFEFSLICLEILPELSFHLLSCQRIPWRILYHIIYFLFPHLRQKQISLLPWLSSNCLSVFHSSSLPRLWSGFIQTCSLFIGTASKGALV